MFSTTLLPACKFLTTLIILGYCAHRCAQVRTCAHTHFLDINSTGKQLGNNHFATCLHHFADNCLIILGYCDNLRTGAHRCGYCAHTHFLDINSTWKQLGNMFSTTLLPACKFLTTFHNFWILCAQVRTGAHKCAHTHYSDMNSTGKQLGNMFSTTLLLACKVFDNFHNFWILCAQVRTGAHKCAHTLFRHEFNLGNNLETCFPPLC